MAMRRKTGMVMVVVSLIITVAAVAVPRMLPTDPVQVGPETFVWYQSANVPWQVVAGDGVLFLVGLVCVAKPKQRP
jgi:hypothetical protein